MSSSSFLESPEAAPPTVIASTNFECTILPTKNSFSGTVVPRMVHKSGRRRIISIEVQRVRQAGFTGNTQHDVERCLVRVLVPATKEKYRQSKRRGRSRRHDDEGSVASHSVEGDDTSTSGISTVLPGEFMDTSPTELEGWKAKYRFPVSKISIKSTHRRSVDVQMDLGKRNDVREIIFDTQEDAAQFEEVLVRERNNDEKRASERIRTLGSGANLQEKLCLLVEVVSGRDLPKADLVSSDPFVKCVINGREVHRTDFISKTLDPIWTIATKSLFLLELRVDELFKSEGLVCVAYDFDKLGSNDPLGSVTIDPGAIFNANGERVEYKLGPLPGRTADVSGYLSFRIRKATDHDKQFMKNYLKSLETRKKVVSETDKEIESKGGSGNLKSLIMRRSRMNKETGDREYKIRPGPDPKREEETTWMTKDALNAECLKPTEQWIDSGSGQLGRIFVEILGCDDLPNLDTGGFAGNKTDAFVSLVFQDSVVMTDIVDDCLAPRWMPWTKRGFIFHMMHGSSQLFLGVFDHDDGINPADDHDLVGRVSVDLSNLRKDTMYTMTYNIYTTAKMTQRKRKGTITIRLRLEIPDERKLLLATLEPPPQMYVNVKTRKEFSAVRRTCNGKYDMEKYNMKVINSYIEELLALQHVSFYAQDALTNLLLWRGTLEVPFGGNEPWKIPIHSISFFLIACTLVEKPQLLPSFFFAAMFWLLIATQDFRRGHPDSWSRCKSFSEFVESLLFGRSRAPPDSIKAFQDAGESQKFLEAWQKRIKDSEDAAAKAYDEQLKAQEEHDREMRELGDMEDLDIATKGGVNVSIDPFKSILYPVQQNLGIVCRYVRHVKHVLSWQECYLSFWIAVGCFLLSIICLYVPWFFIAKWTARLTVWSLLGPWMKLVDIFYVSKIEKLTEEERAEKQEREREERRLSTQSIVAEARIKRENQVKLKAMKKHLFGKFIVRVPVLKEDRYRDLPTPESHAEPYDPGMQPMSELAMQDAGYRKIRVPGQHLLGDMIPKVDTANFTDAPTGYPTLRPELVAQDRPGGSVSPSKVSTYQAYAKVAGMIVLALVITWFVVPWLQHGVSAFLSALLPLAKTQVSHVSSGAVGALG